MIKYLVKQAKNSHHILQKKAKARRNRTLRDSQTQFSRGHFWAILSAKMVKKKLEWLPVFGFNSTADDELQETSSIYLSVISSCDRGKESEISFCFLYWGESFLCKEKGSSLKSENVSRIGLGVKNVPLSPEVFFACVIRRGMPQWYLKMFPRL